MLDAQIKVGHLLVCVGMLLGAGLLVVGSLTPVPLAEAGLAVVVLTCAYGLRLSLVVHDRALRDAFTLGRDHERLQSIK